MRTLLLLVGCAAVAVGCGDDDASAVTDGGVNGSDAALVWMPIDANIPSRPDGGPDTDAGTIRECFELRPVRPELLPRCAASTRTCIDACPMGDAGEACRNDCVARDPWPSSGTSDDMNCGGCLFTQLIACIDAAGCHRQSQALFCCTSDRCPPGDDACVSAMCASESEDFFICGYVKKPACFAITSGDVGLCFSETDPDAGVASDGGVATDGGV